MSERILFFEELTGFQVARVAAGRLLARKGPLGAGATLFGLYRVTPAARWVARAAGRLGLPLRVEEREFDFFDDVEIPGGIPALRECYFKASHELFRQIETESWYATCVQHSCRSSSHENHLHAALSKKIFWELFGRIRSILVVQWISGPEARPVLFLPGDWLFGYLAEYALQWKVELKPLSNRPAVQAAALKEWREFAMRIFYGTRSFFARFLRPAGKSTRARIAVEMYLNGIRHGGIYNNDLFWYRPGALPPGAVIACFRHAQDQPTAARTSILREAGIGSIDQPRVLEAMYSPWIRLPRIQNGSSAPVRALGAVERGFLRALRPYVADFYREYERFYRLFRATSTRIHVSTTDHFPESEALHAALEDAGGVSVSIQRSIEHDSRIFRRTAVDVHFAFCRQNALTERLSGSSVRQFVVAGYLFDGVFPQVREEGRRLRARMEAQGVRHVICFLDENEGVIPRRLGGGRRFRNDYRFLCDRLAEDQSLGLILKPKRPENFKERLGPVWEKIEQAIRIGRCVLLEGSGPDERLLPSVGAAAADLSINILNGGTAGLESVLVGTRCLLLGRGREELGIFRELPEGSVVFESWERLWEAVKTLRADPRHPAIGCWDSILDRLVLPRDGRAAERIGQYIQSLYEAFEAGKDREGALAFARERYDRAWGPDLTSEILQPFLELVS